MEEGSQERDCHKAIKSCQRTSDMPQFCRHMPKEMQDDVWKTESEWFRPWFNRPAYHVLYGHRSEQEASDLVHRLVEGGHLGPTGKVLDAGCGAGRHARALASKAWEVSAFDLSEASIASAQLKGDGQVQFQVLDLRELERQTDWTGRFDVVTNFFTSLGYFSTTEEHDSVIRGFATALKPGGLLLLDYLNVESVRSGLVPYEQVDRQGTLFTIHRRIQGGWIEKSIQFEWEGEYEHHVERVQALHLNDFERILSDHNLDIVSTWGDYQLGPWHPASPRCMILAKLQPQNES